MLYDQKMDTTRGHSIKKYIQDKIDIHGLQIARIDLNFDRTQMLNLLEQRGHAIKVQN